MIQAFDSADPGVAYMAVASWYVHNQAGEWALYRLRFVDRDAPIIQPPYLLVTEKPQVYGMSPVRSADLIDLAISAGRFSAQYRDTIWYLPAEWKGQQPKRVHHKKILSCLRPYESQLLCPFNKEQQGHLIDAIGLGLYHMNLKGWRTCSI